MEIPQFWQNLGGLTAHMGFEVQSVTFPQVFSYDKDIRVYHQSKFPSFNTLRIKSQNYQFSQVIKEDIILHQNLLTIAALNQIRIIESPQFPNIKKREEINVYLFEKICRLSFDMFSLEISNIVFCFFMSLYNARGIETMFWKNIQYCLSLDNESLHMKKSFANNVGQYF